MRIGTIIAALVALLALVMPGPAYARAERSPCLRSRATSSSSSW